jgi:hypothetical protein
MCLPLALHNKVSSRGGRHPSPVLHPQGVEGLYECGRWIEDRLGLHNADSGDRLLQHELEVLREELLRVGFVVANPKRSDN